MSTGTSNLVTKQQVLHNSSPCNKSSR